MKKLILPILFLAFTLTVEAQNAIPETPYNTTSGTLTITATTVTYGGEYAPKHYLAVWVVNSSGAFVKTLMAYYGGKYVSDLTYWNAATPTRNIVDAITGATLNTHATRTATWNGTNASGVLQVDGNYTVKLEMTEKATGKLTSYQFAKGATDETLIPVNIVGFSNISIKWVPTNTALNQIDTDNQYSVYPNPTKGTAFISGFDIQEIELLTISGKSIFTTKDQKIDLTRLPKGIYLAKLNTKTGTYMKKIEKQ
ncbi:MAG: DUF2271 domain-containing protein [Paludibacter sp.]|nr:DUF2271 domain-containing protein [Paludibacter sp.]